MTHHDSLLETTRPVTEIFCLCKSAEVIDGAVNIIGASSRLTAKPPGGAAPQVTAVVSVRFPVEQEGIHHFELNVSDLNGANVSPPATGTAKLAAAGDDIYAWLRLAITFASHQFAEPGDFRFDLAIDGETIATSWLCVVRG